MVVQAVSQCAGKKDLPDCDELLGHNFPKCACPIREGERRNKKALLFLRLADLASRDGIDIPLLYVDGTPYFERSP
ncbi:hypothetical protein LTR16_003322, partial [Cryomyces antarcticus]